MGPSAYRQDGAHNPKSHKRQGPIRCACVGAGERRHCYKILRSWRAGIRIAREGLARGKWDGIGQGNFFLLPFSLRLTQAQNSNTSLVSLTYAPGDADRDGYS